MSKVLVTESHLEDIAGAIRSKNGLSTQYKPGEMPAAILAIPTNEFGPGDEGKVVQNSTLVAQTSKTITANGTHDTTTNNQVVVAVPNSYASGDEGKVVSNGALVSQTGTTVTANGTVNTTTNNQVVVAVPQGESATAVAGDVLNGKTAMVNGAIITGSMTNNGAVSVALDASTQSYTVPAGYHNGSGTVGITVATTAEVMAYLGIS